VVTTRRGDDRDAGLRRLSSLTVGALAATAVGTGLVAVAVGSPAVAHWAHSLDGAPTTGQPAIAPAGQSPQQVQPGLAGPVQPGAPAGQPSAVTSGS